MPQHVFIPLLCIRYNILDRVSMIKAFAYCFPGVLLPLFQAEQHLCTFFKTSLTIFPCCGIVIKSTTWARSSAGRAFGSHPRGREFESLQVHHQAEPKKISARKAQKFQLFHPIGTQCVMGVQSVRAKARRKLKCMSLRLAFLHKDRASQERKRQT